MQTPSRTNGREGKASVRGTPEDGFGASIPTLLPPLSSNKRANASAALAASLLSQHPLTVQHKPQSTFFTTEASVDDDLPPRPQTCPPGDYFAAYGGSENGDRSGIPGLYTGLVKTANPKTKRSKSFKKVGFESELVTMMCERDEAVSRLDAAEASRQEAQDKQQETQAALDKVVTQTLDQAILGRVHAEVVANLKSDLEHEVKAHMHCKLRSEEETKSMSEVHKIEMDNYKERLANHVAELERIRVQNGRYKVDYSTLEKRAYRLKGINQRPPMQSRKERAKEQAEKEARGEGVTALPSEPSIDALAKTAGPPPPNSLTSQMISGRYALQMEDGAFPTVPSAAWEELNFSQSTGVTPIVEAARKRLSPQTLAQVGLSEGDVYRLYRALRVYSVGFHQVVSELCGK
eukprot:gene14613-17267_t